MSHDIDIELLTALGELPAREPTDDELNQEVLDYLAMMAAPPREETLFDCILEAYLADGEEAAIAVVADAHEINGDEEREGLLNKAAHIVQGARMLEREGAVEARG
jgi:hypothetical protein